MSAVPIRKRPPYFYAEVSVDIDPHDLEAAGWVYMGKGSDEGESFVPDDRVIDVVRRWHDDNHDGRWMWCNHELCDELRGRPHDGSDR